MGVGAGDEVILPAQTFIASGLAILMTGAKPVLLIFNTKPNIDPKSIKDKITETKRLCRCTRRIPCDMYEINQIAEENDLTVIEDAAHALGQGIKENLSDPFPL